jgi:hypothetical protein
LLDNVGPSLDLAMFSAAAGVANERPTGLLNGIVVHAGSGGRHQGRDHG